MLSIFFYFIFYSSAVLIYGAGIRHCVVSSKKSDNIFFRFLKAVLCIFSSVSICWFLYRTLLAPLNLEDLLFPMIMLCYLPINTCFNFIFKTSFEKSMPEFTVSFVMHNLGDNTQYFLYTGTNHFFKFSISYYTFIPVYLQFVNALNMQILCRNSNREVLSLLVLQ